MIGDAALPQSVERVESAATSLALEVRDLVVRGDNGLTAVNGLSLAVGNGEILGVAGISGNGQKELVQAIGGQRRIESGEIVVAGAAYEPSRERIRSAGFYTLPEEPLQNATVPSMSVAENLALRTFDVAPLAKSGVILDRAALLRTALSAISRFSIRTPSPESPIRNLSGGNVQRAVLARDLGDGRAKVVVVANPCFGLDFAATAFVHNQLLELRNRGGAVLLVSEDLDELSKLADRVIVVSGGGIVHETTRADLDLEVIGRHMGDRPAAGATARAPSIVSAGR
jgi:simple sugar transport system ATP-binding protein